MPIDDAARAQIERAEALIELGRPEQAVELLATVPQTDPEAVVSVNCALAFAHLRLNQRAEAHASAERAVLSTLGAGCAAPVGAFARVDEASSALVLDARVMSVDGRERVEASGALTLTDAVGRGDAAPGEATSGEAMLREATSDEAARLGADVARQLLQRGAAEVTDLGATKAPRHPL